MSYEKPKYLEVADGYSKGYIRFHTLNRWHNIPIELAREFVADLSKMIAKHDQTLEIRCPHCNNDDLTEIYVTSDGYVSFKCTACSTKFNLDATDPFSDDCDLNIGILEDDPETTEA